MVIPESEYYDTADEEEIASALHDDSRGLRTDFGYWLFKREERDIAMEVSQLHLIQWEKLIIDAGSSTFLRVGSAKGDAVRRLVSDMKLSCIACSSESPESQSGSVEEPKVVRTLRDVLNINTHLRTQEFVVNYAEYVDE